MSEQLVFKDCGSSIKETVAEYWPLKLRRLDRLLSRYRPDLRHLRLSVSRHFDQFEAHCVLSLPTGVLAGTVRQRDCRAALDGVADQMAAEVRRHKGLMRRESYHRRRAARQAVA